LNFAQIARFDAAERSSVELAQKFCVFAKNFAKNGRVGDFFPWRRGWAAYNRV
jgi:hypothetical protein